jgi:hypothetical protein
VLEGAFMGLRISDYARINHDYKSLKKDLELLKEGMAVTFNEVQKVNATLDVIDAIVESEADSDPSAALGGWAHVAAITEADRYPLIKTSEPGIKVQTQVLLRKLDII